MPGLDLDSLSQLMPNESIDDVLDFSDDELIARYGLEVHSVQPGDDAELPESLASELGFRLGLGLPPPPRPQDLCFERIFVARCGRYTLLGVVNSHGDLRICTELTRFISRELPTAVFGTSTLGECGDPEAALANAFQRLHLKASEVFDLRLTGASVTLVLVDPRQLLVAHVGDCRAVLGVPDWRPNAEEFHFTPLPLTQDHKLSVKREFDRVQLAGGDTRKQVNDNVYRLFLDNELVPGLTNTRAIGHLLGHAVGVLHTPTMSSLQRSDLPPGTFLVLGSGGLWATMPERTVVNWIGRHFPSPQEAAESLSAEGHRRWQEPDSPAKAALRRDVEDCFSTIVAFFDDGGEVATLAPRTFASGPNHEGPQRDWVEVKSHDRLLELKQAASKRWPPDGEEPACVLRPALSA